MICGICGLDFAPRFTFETLMKPRPICRDCLRMYPSREHYEAIPTSAGLLQIESMFAGKNADSELESRLWMWHDKLLQRALSQRQHYAVLVWVDQTIELMFPIWFRLFEPLGTIRVIALFEPTFMYSESMQK
jgi:hypothetical protein